MNPTGMRLRTWLSSLICLLIGTTEVSIGAEPTHWSFRGLQRVTPPTSMNDAHPIDRFIAARQQTAGLKFNSEADRRSLIRRLSFDLVGLPPSPEDVAEFVNDPADDAYERLVDRLLSSPHYGERWGKYWLDVAGYADSNGYFNADTDRPLAYRYRDYVVRSLNADKPFDVFVREQLAGDELSQITLDKDGVTTTAEEIELLEATHFLRNGPDGSGESDGNPDEVRADRYYALEAAQQILVSSLFGLTIQCAKCHDHKFEPITQREYYRLQAVLYPAFNIEKWRNPNDRVVFARRPGELERWQTEDERINREIAALRAAHADWQRRSRPKSAVLFEDTFDDGPAESFTAQWSNTAPGDDGPGGTSVVTLATHAGVAPAPAAERVNGTLRIVEGGNGGDKWVVTKSTFDWTPDKQGDWIQVTFDLLDRKLDQQGTPAERVAFFIAAHDFNDNGSTAGGNILVDGNPAGGAAVFVDYPGKDERSVGSIGKSGYQAGRNFGLRVTNIGQGKFRVEQLVDWTTEERTIDLKAEDLPNGAFGFEYCCGRSFIVDNVLIESSQGRNDLSDSDRQQLTEFMKELEQRRASLDRQTKNLETQRLPKPRKLAWTTDLQVEPPVVKRLDRGNPMTPSEVVEVGVLQAIDDGSGDLPALPSKPNRTTGRRLALAHWVTQPNSRAAALLARVQVNRIWQQHFGRALAPTADNLGTSGTPPSHPELLEWLAAEFVRSNWSLKSLHRQIVTSHTYRQSSQLNDSTQQDLDNKLLARFPLRRLDAEALRDALLSVSNELQPRLSGAYVPTQRSGTAEVLVDEQHPGAFRRTIYLQQRRTQTLSLLNLFDAPSLVVNCVQRPTTTMPLQSLTMLNSDFAIRRAKAFAARATRDASEDAAIVNRLYEIAIGRAATSGELAAASSFLAEQTREYGGAANGRERALTDIAQMVLASNAFLYVE